MTVRYLFGTLFVEMKDITPKQLQLLEWIQQYLETHHTMPSRREIGEGLGLSSPATIQQHIEALEKKGFLKRGETRESRALHWTQKSKKFLEEIHQKGLLAKAKISSARAQMNEAVSNAFELPLLGTIAAGYPIEVYPEARNISLPLDLFLSPRQAEAMKKDLYVLSVRGDSMIEEGIFPNDWVVLKKVSQAKTGDTVAAMVNGEATLKKLFKTKVGFELHPANPKYPIIPIGPEDRFEIQGILVGLVRKYDQR